MSENTKLQQHCYWLKLAVERANQELSDREYASYMSIGIRTLVHNEQLRIQREVAGT